MKAMCLITPGEPLQETDLPTPVPSAHQVLIEVQACAVCRTDLHVIDQELPNPKLPLIPGHEIVGAVVARGRGVRRHELGDRVGVPWLAKTCGRCEFCRRGQENLCDRPRFTGYTVDGGYAQYAVAEEDFCFSIPNSYGAEQGAPLLCAGLIGYRSLVKTGQAQTIGIYGFGAAAHILTQVASFQGREIFAFTRPGDRQAQRFATEVGAVWAGGSGERPPRLLDAAIIFAPAGALVPLALQSVKKGGAVVCGGIHMSDLPAIPYRWLWEERSIVSVANLTRKDGNDFLALAARFPIKTRTVPFPLARANQALDQLRSGHLTGAAVLIPPPASSGE